MLNNKTFLAIIPARSGSKRLPNKNILDLSGKPLISWTIEASLGSKYIDKTMVTTDSEKIREVALQHGAETPFARPRKISDDIALIPDVINHTVNFYKNQKNEEYDYFIYLQPTSPLRNQSHIDYAIEYLFEKNADAIVSVCKVEHPVEWTGILPENKNMSDFVSNLDFTTRSQDFPSQYRLNGAIYICAWNKFIESGSHILKENIFAYEMPQNVSIDIDEELDLLFAKTILDSRHQE